MTRLSIVIVSYNSRDDLGAALASIAGAAVTTTHDVVVVDNASTDSTTALVREQWPQVRLIASPANLGFAGANNAGVRVTSSELLLFLNPDTILSEGAIDRLVAVLDARSEVSIVGPRIVDARGRAELSFGAMMTPWAELRQKFLVRGNDRGWSPVTAIVDRQTRRGQLVDWVSGACLLIRRADFDSVGGFDERYFMYAEDVDLCAMVRRRGGKVLFAPDVEVVHLRGRSAASAPGTASDAHRRSQLAFYAKHHPVWVPILRAYLKVRGRLPDTSP